MERYKMKDFELFNYYEIKPFEKYNRAKVLYTKKGKDQYAIFMDYGENDWKCVEDNHLPYNRLNEKEKEFIGQVLAEDKMWR